jgi:hypothetical protein
MSDVPTELNDEFGDRHTQLFNQTAGCAGWACSAFRIEPKLLKVAPASPISPTIRVIARRSPSSHSHHAGVTPGPDDLVLNRHCDETRSAATTSA